MHFSDCVVFAKVAYEMLDLKYGLFGVEMLKIETAEFFGAGSDGSWHVLVIPLGREEASCNILL